MLFSQLPTEIIQLFMQYTCIRDEKRSSGISSFFLSTHRENSTERLSRIKSNELNFNLLLSHIIANEKDGFAILHDKECMNILIEQTPKNLPHWILGLAECQPNLVYFLLWVPAYKNLLTLEEFRHLQSYESFGKFIISNGILPPESELTDRCKMDIEDDFLFSNKV
ncbi:hypothetical protein NKV53_03090 [Legionella sp. 27cVA30]|uniref:hypothetical protein n=1 Tax=Legionella sp. 27cVA30 TaxID=2905657 RepID=UPI00209CF903|nr:hypothetical protein [Legionella sp. 27cVA30]MCP0913351.1 hypothetical protein [Legionella sp. 27cVA30]